MKIQKGDILNCYKNSLLSRVIRNVTKSRYNHTALVLEIWGQLYIIDSQGKGTNLIKLEAWKKKTGILED